MPDFRKRRLVEELWNGRLTNARAKYDLAVAASKTANADFDNRALPTPDGGLNLIQALRLERRARDEYMRVLQIFNDLVLRDKMPPGE